MSNHVYSDHYLNHYADRYMSLCLRWHKITLLQYLANPEACERVAEEAAEKGRAVEPLILPQRISVMEATLRQEAEAERYLAAEDAQARLERGLEELPRRDGRIIEPLRHHSWAACGYHSDAGRNRA